MADHQGTVPHVWPRAAGTRWARRTMDRVGYLPRVRRQHHLPLQRRYLVEGAAEQLPPELDGDAADSGHGQRLGIRIWPATWPWRLHRRRAEVRSVRTSPPRVPEERAR